MLPLIGEALGEGVKWVGTVVDALISTDGALHSLLPLVVIGIGLSLLMFGVKVVRSFTWGA